MNLLASRLCHGPGVLSQQLKQDDPAIVLLSPQSGEYYTLDEIGSQVWELCDGAHSVAEIVAIISQEYDAPAEVIEADVLELVQELADEKLLVPNP